MIQMLTILMLLCATPAWARDLDTSIQLRLDEQKIEASYQHGNRGLAERLVNVYCLEQFGKSGNLQRGACTKMLPMEANRCIARGLCE